MKHHDVYAIPDVLNSPLIQQLRVDEARATARLANSQATLGLQYPSRKALESELASLRATIGTKVTQIVWNSYSNARDARAREASVESRSAALEVGDASQQQLQLSILERRPRTQDLLRRA